MSSVWSSITVFLSIRTKDYSNLDAESFPRELFEAAGMNPEMDLAQFREIKRRFAERFETLEFDTSGSSSEEALDFNPAFFFD